MTPLFLQDGLEEEIKKVLSLQLTANSEGFHIYAQSLPPKQDAKDCSVFPYCLISLGDGEQNSEFATQDVVITFGARDTKLDYQGYRDIANAIESTRQHLIKNQIIGERFALQLPIRWVIPQAEDTYPFYFGAMILTYSLPMVEQINLYT